MTDLVPIASNEELQKYNQLAQTILNAIEEGDIQTVSQFTLALQKNRHFSSLILANVLTRLHDNWHSIAKRNEIHEDFFSFVEGEMLIKPSTTQKYVAMWRSIFQNPNISDEVKNKLKYKSMNFLLRLTALAMENPSEEVWEQVLSCETISELRELIRSIRGEATSSKTAIIFHYNVREGTLYVTQGDLKMILAVTSKPIENKEQHLKFLAVMLERLGANVI